MQANLSQGPYLQIDPKVYVGYLIRYWYLLVLGLAFGAAFAFYNVRYSKATYTTSARMLVKDEYSSWGQEYFLPGMELVSGRNRLINEIGIIKSYPLMQRVADSLEWDVSYFKVGNIKTSEFYPSSPFKVRVLSGKAPEGMIYLKLDDQNRFSISEALDRLPAKTNYKLNEKFNFS